MSVVSTQNYLVSSYEMAEMVTHTKMKLQARNAIVSEHRD